MAENTKMEVEGNASETIDEQENEENMDEAGGEGADSSDSEDSDGNEAVHDPRIQQLELQVVYLCTLACAQLSVCPDLYTLYKEPRWTFLSTVYFMSMAV